MCCGDPSDCSKPCEPSHAFREWDDENGYHVVEETHVFPDGWMRRYFEEVLKDDALLLISFPRKNGKVSVIDGVLQW